ncbi:MAG TPA: ABC transporter ATP-binding protein, partial [Chromatiales bacterium]|nr:ABC transporter ATP-binding protein [Chromatiales bacterium]
MTLLEGRGLHIRIGEHQVCRDAHLRIHSGQCWGLLGRNGSGKTTLLRALAGLHPLEEGEIRLEESPLRSLPRRAIARRLGLLLQEDAFPFPVTVEEAVLTGRHPHLPPLGWESAKDRRIAHDALAAVRMTGFAQRLTSTLSGGERRRVAIATLLAQAPILMLLDEPTNHLDLDQQIRILTLLRERI